MAPRKKTAPTSPVKVHSTAIEMVALGDLKAYEKNARTHPEDQLAALEAIVRDSGFTAPLVIDAENGIIAGHGRALVAKRLKMDAVPCVRVTGLSAAQVKALRLSDNQAALRGGWDKDMLLGELTALGAEGFDMGLTAFTPFELGQIKVPGFLPDEQIERAEATPPPPARPVVKAGEIWVMGDHRLIIGDATAAGTVDRLLAGAKPHLMVTDPPYGVNYDPSWRNGLDTVKRAQGKVANDGQADWSAAWKLFAGAVAYVWHSGTMADIVAASLKAQDFQVRAQIIWVKPHYAISRGHYHPQHEPCLYVVRGTGNWNGSRKESTVWQIANGTFQGGKQEPENAKTGHGTQKPIECMRRPILNNSKPGDSVYEPFAGSGTTLIACEMEGRRCFAIEIDPAYAEVIIRRWEGFTKRTAAREDGRTLADLAKPKRKAA